MLLEEQSGRSRCRGGFQFYAGSRERVAVAFTPELREQTFGRGRAVPGAVRAQPDAAGPAAAGVAEALLRVLARARCVCRRRRCTRSAVPDTRATGAEVAAPPELKRVMPGSDDGAVLYLQEPGSFVGKSQRAPRGEASTGLRLAKVPMHAVRQVVVFGNVQVSTQALQTLVENEIPVMYLTGHGKFIGAFQPPPAKNVGLARGPVPPKFADPAECLLLGQSRRCGRRSANQRALLDALACGATARRGQGRAGGAGHRTGLQRTRSTGRRNSGRCSASEGQGAALYFGGVRAVPASSAAGQAGSTSGRATAGRRKTR